MKSTTSLQNKVSICWTPSIPSYYKFWREPAWFTVGMRCPAYLSKKLYTSLLYIITDILNPSKRYNSDKHQVYSCQYHVIFCPKYRRKGLKGQIASRLRTARGLS